MAMKRIPIAEASLQQLRDYAEVMLGLELKFGNNATQIIAKIEQASPGITEIVVSAEAEPTEEQMSQRIGSQPFRMEDAVPERGPSSADDVLLLSFRRDPRVVLEIPSHAGAGGQTPVSVAVNGVAFSIHRDKEVAVPYRVFEALHNAREHIREQVEGSAVNGVMAESNRTSLAYPYNVHEMPSKAAVMEWRKETDDLTV